MSRSITGGPGTSSPGQISYNDMSLKDLVFNAYRVQFYQLETPFWMEGEYFDVIGKLPAGATRDDVQLMLQSLLAERFKLRIHHEQKPFRGYILTVGKSGSKVNESPALPTEVPAAPDRGKSPRFESDKEGFIIIPPGTANMISTPPRDGMSRLTGARETMGVLCGYLSRQLEQPVVDETGLTGIYDFHLAWAPDDLSPPSQQASSSVGDPNSERLRVSQPAPNLVQAVERQLGLRMERKAVSVDCIVIDHIEKAPIEN